MIPIINIRQCCRHHILIMRIPIPGKMVFILKWGLAALLASSDPPWSSCYPMRFQWYPASSHIIPISWQVVPDCQLPNTTLLSVYSYITNDMMQNCSSTQNASWIAHFIKYNYLTYHIQSPQIYKCDTQNYYPTAIDAIQLTLDIS